MRKCKATSKSSVTRRTYRSSGMCAGISVVSDVAREVQMTRTATLIVIEVGHATAPAAATTARAVTIRMVAVVVAPMQHGFSDKIIIIFWRMHTSERQPPASRIRMMSTTRI